MIARTATGDLDHYVDDTDPARTVCGARVVDTAEHRQLESRDPSACLRCVKHARRNPR